jgi:hypothetical protein
MSEKQVKKYKRIFNRYEKRIWRSALDFYLRSVPQRRGIERAIFCFQLVFQKNVANFIQQRIYGYDAKASTPKPCER